MIAYNAVKDSEGNIIDCDLHMGWNGEDDSRQKLSEIEYDSNIGILWLEIDKSRIPHVCSDNYVEGNNRYCSCQVYGDLHPNHVHSYDRNNNSDSSHWLECICGEKDQIQSHSFSFRTVSPSGEHYYFCECGYMYTGSHIYTYSPVSDALHRAACACGHFTLEAHNLRPDLNPRYWRCQLCDYVVDNWNLGGGNVIMGTKKEDEIE